MELEETSIHTTKRSLRKSQKRYTDDKQDNPMKMHKEDIHDEMNNIYDISNQGSSSKKKYNKQTPISHQKYQIKEKKINVGTRRFIIDRIILENFKSYYGKQTIGPFHKNFTSIVGPNGSGKSNLIECLLFIFGKHAKKMRLQKLNQLIHNSSSHVNIKKASVEVHFQTITEYEDGTQETVEDSFLSIRRSVNQSSQSKYEINNQESSHKEVTQLLKSKGIDLDHNRFLILQGEVEQISLMKPKGTRDDEEGLLEYLEDIIGSNQYKTDIENFEKMQDGLVVIRKEKGELIRIAKDELNKLDEAKTIAIKYVKTEEYCYKILNITLQIVRHKANKELMQSEQFVEEMNGKLKEINKRVKEKIKENESVIKSYNQKKKALNETQNKIDQCQNKYLEMEKKDVGIKHDLERNLQQKLKSEENLEDLKSQTDKINNNLKDLQENLPKLQKEVENLQKSKEVEEEKLNKLLNQLKDQTENYQIQKKEIQKQIEPYIQKVNGIQNEINLLKSELNMLVNQNDNYQEEINELNKKKNDALEQIDQLRQVLDQIDLALKNIQEQKQEIIRTLDDYAQQEKKLSNDLNEIKMKLQENQQDRSENFRSNDIINELMKAQQRSELNGIQGRLGDLGAIDEQYDIPITTVCYALNNIVVENMDQAQKCIEYLRNNKLGKASFIALDQMEQYRQQMIKPFQAPNQSSRLFDLVKIRNPKFQTAFYFALRDTLVCQDLDTATKIAYGPQRFKCVDLQGHVIDQSGTMSGGGRPKQGGMSSKIPKQISQDLIKQLSEQRDQKQKELEELQNQKQNAINQMKNLDKDQAIGLKEKSKMKIDLEFQENQLKTYESKMNELNKILQNKQNDELHKKKIESQLEQYDKERNELNDQMLGYKQQIDQIEKQISDIGGKALQQQKISTASIIEKYEEKSKEQTKNKATSQNLNKKLKQIQNETSAEEKKVEKSKQIIEKLKKEQTDLENEALEILGQAKGLQDQKTQIETQLEQNSSEKDKIDSIIGELKHELEEGQSKLDSAKQVKKRAQEEYYKKNQELERYRNDYKNIIKDYDFLDSINEIESFSIKDNNQLNESHNESINQGLNESIIETSINNVEISLIQSNENELELNNNVKKKVKIAIDQKMINDVNIFQDLTQDQLDIIENQVEMLKAKYTFEQEKLKKTQPNLTIINEFRIKFLEYKVKAEEYEKILNEISDVHQKIQDLRQRRHNEFMTGFSIINCKLKETYQILTKGGDAELELLDSLDPFSEGVVFSVRPPKKSWKQMLKLSGGEKTLSSLALVFALHYYKPTPLYFMDEIDAALDFKNVGIIAKYLKERTKGAQFIIISLRNNMFELADLLVGIYKTNDTTKTILFCPNLQEKQRKQQENQEKQKSLKKSTLKSKDSSKKFSDINSNKLALKKALNLD